MGEDYLLGLTDSSTQTLRKTEECLGREPIGLETLPWKRRVQDRTGANVYTVDSDVNAS